MPQLSIPAAVTGNDRARDPALTFAQHPARTNLQPTLTRTICERQVSSAVSPHECRRTSAGSVGLDEILSGGFVDEHMYLVTGGPGTGKTTLGLQFLMEGARRGERCALLVLAESTRDVQALAASHGWSLDGIDVVSVAIGRSSDSSFFTPSDLELDAVGRRLLDELTRVAARRVVIDPLAELRLLAQEPLRYRRQIMSLKTFFDEHPATVLMTDVATDADEERETESLFHGIIDLEQLAPDYGGQRRRLRVRKLRESSFRDGFHDFTIGYDGLAVFPRLVAAEHNRDVPFGIETCSTGVEGLDALLGGGIDRGTSTMVIGPAGVGKSTVSTQLAVAAMDRGERAALFLFDELVGTLIARGDQLGMRLGERVRAGAMTTRQIDTAELSPGQFAHEVRHCVEHDGARVVVIDSVNGYSRAMPQEHFLISHLHELLTYLSQQRVMTILVVTQQGLLGQVTTPPDISYLADTVLLLRYFEAGAEFRQAISVLKRRLGPHERSVRELFVDARGVRVGPPLRDVEGVVSGPLLRHAGGDGARTEEQARRHGGASS